MGESKIKHVIGFLHSIMWVYVFMRRIGYDDEEMLKSETNALLRFSISYYVQDIAWSFYMKQYFIILHHVCVSTFWYFLIRDEPAYLYASVGLLYDPMLLAEISAAWIHLKHIIETSLTHHICMITYVVTRIMFFPTLILPYHCQRLMIDKGHDMYLVGGFVLNVFVVVFSFVTVFTKWKTFRRSFLWCFCVREKTQ